MQWAIGKSWESIGERGEKLRQKDVEGRGDVAKLHMSVRHATFDNAGDGRSRTIPAKSTRKYNARSICQK